MIEFYLFYKVGRIIGKGGQNVRELQRVTGSIIKLPEQAAASPTSEEETTVHIIGPFFSVQSAQRRIRALLSVTNPPPASGSGRQKQSSSGQQTPQHQGTPTTPQKPQNTSNVTTA
jgi:insulin-like growth factor 2 mRNA-binding protein 1